VLPGDSNDQLSSAAPSRQRFCPNRVKDHIHFAGAFF
jgi:hypothetical protein